MKRILLCALGLLSSAAFAHQNCNFALQKTLLGRFKHPAESLGYVRPRYAYATELKTLRRTVDRNFITHLTGALQLGQRTATGQTSEIAMGGKFYTVSRENGLTIRDFDGDKLLEWARFDDVVGKKGELTNPFRQSNDRVFTSLKLYRADEAIAVFMRFLHEVIIEQTEAPGLEDEIRARLIYMHWLDTTIATAERKAP